MKKTHKLTVRVDESDYQMIKLKAEISEMSISKFLVEKAKNSNVRGYAKAKAERDSKASELEQMQGQIDISDF